MHRYTQVHIHSHTHKKINPHSHSYIIKRTYSRIDAYINTLIKTCIPMYIYTRS